MREALSSALGLLALLVVVQYDVIFLGRSLISTNYSNPVDYRGFVENYGPNYVPHEEWTRRNLWPYANIRDPGATWWQWEPGTQFLKQAIHDREWPFWDPYIAAGTPAMANLIPAFFFPPFLVVVLLGASPTLLNGYFLFLAWGASFATYLFVRRHDVGGAAAMVSAIAVMLSGAVHQHLGTFIGQTAVCLPAVLLATRWFFDRPSGRRAVAMAVVYAMTALASFPPLLLAIFSIAALYGVVVLVGEVSGPARWRAGAYWASALAISVGLVAFYYLPALAARAASPQMAEHYRLAGVETMPVWHLYQLLSGTLMGGIVTYLVPAIAAPGAYLPYIGLTTIALALLARASNVPRRRTLLFTSGLAIAVIVLKLVGAPVVQWIGQLPTLREIHIVHYFSIPVGVLIAFLAGLGVQALIEGTITRLRGAIVALAALAATESLWHVGVARGAFSSRGAEYWLRDWHVLAAITVPVAAAIFIATVVRRQPRANLAMVALLTALLTAEGLYNGWYPNPAAWDMFAHPAAYVQSLQRRGTLDRVFTYGAPNANINSAYRVFTLDSLMAFNPPRIYRLYQRYGAPPPQVFMRGAERMPPEAVLDRANVAVIGINLAFTPVVGEAVSRGYARAFDDGFIGLFERRTLPRFFFSSDYRVVAENAALDAIASGDPRQVVLETDPGMPASPNAATDPAVRVEAYRRNSAVVDVDAPRPGLLYASESFFGGWRATVNGTPAEILPANFAFRAVAVPAGRSQVVFRYWPPRLTEGLVVSLLSLIAAMALVAAPRFTVTGNREDGDAREDREDL
jgi:hypothetical protein